MWSVYIKWSNMAGKEIILQDLTGLDIFKLTWRRLKPKTTLNLVFNNRNPICKSKLVLIYLHRSPFNSQGTYSDSKYEISRWSYHDPVRLNSSLPHLIQRVLATNCRQEGLQQKMSPLWSQWEPQKLKLNLLITYYTDLRTSTVILYETSMDDTAMPLYKPDQVEDIKKWLWLAARQEAFESQILGDCQSCDSRTTGYVKFWVLFRAEICV